MKSGLSFGGLWIRYASLLSSGLLSSSFLTSIPVAGARSGTEAGFSLAPGLLHCTVPPGHYNPSHDRSTR